MFQFMMMGIQGPVRRTRATLSYLDMKLLCPCPSLASCSEYPREGFQTGILVAGERRTPRHVQSTDRKHDMLSLLCVYFSLRSEPRLHLCFQKPCPICNSPVIQQHIVWKMTLAYKLTVLAMLTSLIEALSEVSGACDRWTEDRQEGRQTDRLTWSLSGSLAWHTDRSLCDRLILVRWAGFLVSWA